MSEAAQLFDLGGQVAIVTGASSGLGRHFALTLARNGAKVAAAARRAEPLDELVRQIAAFDGRAIAVPLDVTDPASVRESVRVAETELGPVSILINNAGVALDKPVFEQEEADWDRVLDTNLKGAWLMAQEVAAHMAKLGQEVAAHMAKLGHGGAIVNIASIMGVGGANQLAPYCASKGGLINLTRALAVELARHDIRVNALAPGYIETEMNREVLESDAGRTMVKRVPQRRFGRPEDLDGALLLLASNAGRFITGSVLVVDGGQAAKI
jgi:NAD(P)-dependent dehydrogenase (short-subunit alcohol dehydrogenase family)